MEMLYSSVEMIATCVENLIILLSVTAASGQKRTGWSHILYTLFLSLGSSAIVVAMNSISVFSFLTPLLTMSFVVFIASKITSEGSLVVRLTSCILTYLVIQTIDYILVVFVGFCYGVPNEIFTVFTALGPRRSVYLLFDKLSDVIIYLLVRKQLARLNSLSKKLQYILCSFSVAAYVVMQLLYNTIITPDLVTMQIAVISSWFFILCFITAILVLFSALTKSEHDKQTQKMLQTENVLMAKNYQAIHADKIESAKRQHDFNHHLRMIQHLAENQNYIELSKYINSLLAVPFREIALCHSGNDFIDAIINCKAAEAEQDGITFEFAADFHLPTSLDPVDICGILSNQIDNALEACRAICTDTEKKVIVTIKQKENFAFFTVKNTVSENPLLDNPDLHSTKTDNKTPHGLGIKNIRETAEKNSGSLLYEFEDGLFISTVSLCFQLLDT